MPVLLFFQGMGEEPGWGEAGNNSWNVRQDGQGTQVGTETFELEGRGGGLREVK